MQFNAVVVSSRCIMHSTNEISLSFVINIDTLGISSSVGSTYNHRNDDHLHEVMNMRYSNYVLTIEDLVIYFSPNFSPELSCKIGLKPYVLSTV